MARTKGSERKPNSEKSNTDTTLSTASKPPSSSQSQILKNIMVEKKDP